MAARSMASVFSFSTGLSWYFRMLTRVYRWSDAATGEYGPDKQEPLNVEIPESVASLFTSKQLSALREALSYDPRPGYQTDESRGYGFAYGGYDIRFRVSGQTATVTDAIKIND